uniref:Uncharacterized protein n=1 Tax=Panagrolaimus sp. ES5 TaxID=591445 RepID=A0AC34FHX2_9BILA
MEKITSKLWITLLLGAGVKTPDKPNLVSSLIPKLHQCDARHLYLCGQTFSFKDFYFLSSNVKKLNLYHVACKNDDGSDVAFEKLVEACLKVKEISFIPEAFDLDAFYGYMKKNVLTEVDLKFGGSLSDAYKARLDIIIDEIFAENKYIETEKYKPPIIYISELDRYKAFKLGVLRHNKTFFADLM